METRIHCATNSSETSVKNAHDLDEPKVQPLEDIKSKVQPLEDIQTKMQSLEDIKGQNEDIKTQNEDIKGQRPEVPVSVAIPTPPAPVNTRSRSWRQLVASVEEKRQKSQDYIVDQVTSSPCFTCVDSLSLYELKQKASKSLECYLPLARDENGAVATSSLEKDMGLRAGTTSFARRGVPRRGEVERAHRDERALHRGSRPSPSSLGGRTPDLVSGKSPSPSNSGGPASDAGPVAQSP